jgi:hypothetical protein
MLPSQRADAVGFPVPLISELNTQPTDTPVQRFKCDVTAPSHGSGPEWFAMPSLYDSFIRYSMPVYPALSSPEGLPHIFRFSRLSL